MITKAYIHDYGNNKIEPEHLDVMETLTSRGVPCELFTSKKLARNQLQPDASTLVVGDHSIMSTVFKRLMVTPINDCYPESLHGFLNRKIWTTNVRKLLKDYPDAEKTPFFVKPKSTAKLFNGFVVNNPVDLYHLDGIAKDTEIYCSTVVNWLSEYRVFVHQSKIVGVKWYAGDKQHSIDMEVVQSAIGTFAHAEQRTVAYAIDFGVLENGSTALVEWNDAYALGSYGLEKDIYTDMIIARWEEIFGI